MNYKASMLAEYRFREHDVHELRLFLTFAGAVQEKSRMHASLGFNKTPTNCIQSVTVYQRKAS